MVERCLNWVQTIEYVTHGFLFRTHFLWLYIVTDLLKFQYALWQLNIYVKRYPTHNIPIADEPLWWSLSFKYEVVFTTNLAYLFYADFTVRGRSDDETLTRALENIQYYFRSRYTSAINIFFNIGPSI